MPDTGKHEKVQAREETITLPTYSVKAENRNPVFRSQYGVAHIYPYTLLDDIEARKKDRTYRTLVLENQYLRVVVIPDLGGRVYSVYDKISQREVFYKNAIVRFAPLAIRGAFFSGGVEFSFPVAHAPTTCDKVNWTTRENADGSASVVIGGLEHISRLRWMITLTLFPGRCALAQDVHLFNPGDIPGRYHYWTNASLDANDGTEFIYPLQRARSYEYAGTASWPFARLDLIQEDPGLPGMEGVPMWPASRILEPINFRWQKNMLAQVSIFGRNVEWDYFGAWQHRVNHGYAHVARSHDVSGMKLWSWGNAPVGVVNQASLTDDGSVYAETQCGAMETQLDFDFLQPGKKRAWREWWLPLRGIDGLTCASETLGARISLLPEKNDEFVGLKVALCPALQYDDALVTLSVPGSLLMKEICSLSPQQPWIHETQVRAADIADKAISLVVKDAQGNLLLENVQSRQPAGIEPFAPQKNLPPASAEDFYQQGLKHENFDNREQAREAYQKALSLDNTHRQTHLRLGLMLLRAAQYKEADQHLEQALKLGLPEAACYRGLIAFYEGRLADAEGHFTVGQGGPPVAAACVMGLGKVALRRKDWQQAVGLFKQACALDPGSAAPATLLAIAQRHAGQVDDARTSIQQILAQDPLNHPALHELVFGQHTSGEAARQEFHRILADDYQYYLDLACYYLDAGLPQDALEVLRAAWTHKENAMTAYLAAFLSRQVEDAKAEQEWLDKAHKASAELGFPSRLEEVQALEFALEQEPKDAKARYFLGNFCYAHERYDEGVRLWHEALKGMPAYDVLLRNLGLAAWQRKNNPAEAVEWFEKALGLNPNNQDLFLHLDDLYKALNLKEKRAQLLTSIRALADAREDVHKRSIAMMVDLGQHEEAIELLAKEKFIPLEMDQSFHNVYVQALMLRAKSHLDSGRLEEAASDYLKMLEYPDNLGVGAPTTRAQADIYYQLGLAYEKLGRYRQAIAAWREAASEYHAHGKELYACVQMALDKLSRYSELGLDE